MYVHITYCILQNDWQTIHILNLVHAYQCPVHVHVCATLLHDLNMQEFTQCQHKSIMIKWQTVNSEKVLNILNRWDIYHTVTWREKIVVFLSYFLFVTNYDLLYLMKCGPGYGFAIFYCFQYYCTPGRLVWQIWIKNELTPKQNN